VHRDCLCGTDGSGCANLDESIYRLDEYHDEYDESESVPSRPAPAFCACAFEQHWFVEHIHAVTTPCDGDADRAFSRLVGVGLWPVLAGRDAQ
jgi:hypothetical protein